MHILILERFKAKIEREINFKSVFKFENENNSNDSNLDDGVEQDQMDTTPKC